MIFKKIPTDYRIHFKVPGLAFPGPPWSQYPYLFHGPINNMAKLGIMTFFQETKGSFTRSALYIF